MAQNKPKTLETTTNWSIPRTTPQRALLQAIEAAGGQTELAAQLNALLKNHPDAQMRKRNITQAHVATWVHRNRVSPDMCLAIEAATGVAASWLRPDVHYELNALQVAAAQ